MKNRKIEQARAEFVKLKDGRTKVTVTKGEFNENDNWTIWFPEEPADRFGCIPTELVKKRMMHDYAIELGHYSSTMSMEK